MSLSAEFLEYFSDLEDTRSQDRNFRYPLESILAITILGSICGADTWIDLELFARSKEDWLCSLLDLPDGVPSHDTLNRVFSCLDSEKFESCFIDWADSFRKDLYPKDRREIIAIDGKTMRRSHDHRKKHKALHMVSAWAVEQKLSLGQLRTEEKSNEIEAIPRLLKMLDIKDSIITIDAMGCQKEIAATIIDKQADYVLALKDNQPRLADSVAKVFAIGEATEFKDMHNRRMVEKEKGHGRIEYRRYSIISTKDNWAFDTRWPGMRSIGMVESKRTINHKTTRATRYFITSLSFEQIVEFKRAVRKHWDIENNLHWSLDVSFDDDHNRNRKDHAPENLAIVRRIALNLLKQETETRAGIAAKRKKAGWDDQYLEQILLIQP